MEIEATQQYLSKYRSDLQHKMKNFGGGFFIDKKSQNYRALDILLIEDDLSEVDQFQKALSGAGIEFNLISLSDKTSAIKYLNREAPYSTMPIPDLVVIDMCSPKIESEKIVDYMRSESALQGLPILTATDDVREITSSTDKSYSHSCPVSKPFSSEKIKKRFASIILLSSFLPFDNLSLGNV